MSSSPNPNWAWTEVVQAGGQLTGLEILRPIGVLLYHALDAIVAARLGSSKEAIAPRTNSSSPDLPTQTGLPSAELVQKLLDSKREDGLSKRYLETLRSHLVRFAAAFPGHLHLITAPELEEWLRQQPIGPRARNNIRGSLLTLFHFARKYGHLPKGKATEADEIARAKDRGGKIGILRPDDLALVLHRAPESVRLFLALGAFTGMRSSELLRLAWADVNFERAFITVAAEKAKTATRRLVPLHPNLSRWLAGYRASQGKLFPTARAAGRAIAFAKSCGVPWPNNALRHSYATYRLAVTADAARVALEMGNSPQKLITNYRELAAEQEGKSWFNIAPARPANVIPVSPN